MGWQSDNEDYKRTRLSNHQAFLYIRSSHPFICLGFALGQLYTGHRSGGYGSETLTPLGSRSFGLLCTSRLCQAQQIVK